MTTAKGLIGTRTQLSGAAAAMNGLASATYVNCGTITFASSSKVPLSVKLEVTVTPSGTVASSKHVLVFLQQSLDGTNFETGPTSGTTTTDEPNLTYIGRVPCNTNSTLQRKVFDLAARLRTLPHSAKVIICNVTGIALHASTGNDVHTITVDGDLTA